MNTFLYIHQHALNALVYSHQFAVRGEVVRVFGAIYTARDEGEAPASCKPADDATDEPGECSSAVLHSRHDLLPGAVNDVYWTRSKINWLGWLLNNDHIGSTLKFETESDMKHNQTNRVNWTLPPASELVVGSLAEGSPAGVAGSPVVVGSPVAVAGSPVGEAGSPVGEAGNLRWDLEEVHTPAGHPWFRPCFQESLLITNWIAPALSARPHPRKN